MANRRSNRDRDIATSAPAPGLGWRGNSTLWVIVFGLAFCLLYLNPFAEISPWWVVAALVAVMFLSAAAYVAWMLAIKRGMFTWMRLAFRPAKLMAQGEAAQAEAACAIALARARHFAPNDRRRGAMLCELAMFVKNQGRFQEALDLYEESSTILQSHADREPYDYFVVLNNHAIVFIQLRDFEAAQHILEKAINLTLSARKREAGSRVTMPLGQVQMIEFVLHLNLAFLFMEMHEMREAELQLQEADALAPLLSKGARAGWFDHYVGICALWEFESGKLAAAEKELAEARNPGFPSCLRVRAKLCLARQDYAEAEVLLGQYQDIEKKKGTLHRPDLLKATLDVAEALFGQGKADDAFAAFQEARSIVAEFALPVDGAWRKTLESWLQRARHLSKPNFVEALETELKKAPAPPSSAVTILDKLRIRQE